MGKGKAGFSTTGNFNFTATSDRLGSHLIHPDQQVTLSTTITYKAPGPHPRQYPDPVHRVLSFTQPPNEPPIIPGLPHPLHKPREEKDIRFETGVSSDSSEAKKKGVCMYICVYTRAPRIQRRSWLWARSTGPVQPSKGARIYPRPAPGPHLLPSLFSPPRGQPAGIHLHGYIFAPSKRGVAASCTPFSFQGKGFCDLLRRAGFLGRCTLTPELPAGQARLCFFESFGGKISTVRSRLPISKVKEGNEGETNFSFLLVKIGNISFRWGTKFNFEKIEQLLVIFVLLYILLHCI